MKTKTLRKLETTAQTATAAVVHASAIPTGGTDAMTHYSCGLVNKDGIEKKYKGRVDIEIDATFCLVVPEFVTCHTHTLSARRTRK